MRLRNFSFLGAVNRVAPAAPSFSPASLANLACWWKADALALNDNDPVVTWDDASGGGHTLTSTINRPTYKINQINGKPAVSFNGSSNAMSTPLDLSGSGNVSVMAACTVRAISPWGNDVVWEHTSNYNSYNGSFILYTINNGFENGSHFASYNGSNGPQDGSWCYLSFVLDVSLLAHDANMWRNGTRYTAYWANDNLFGTLQNSTFYLAARGGSSLWTLCSFGELILYSDAKNDTDRGLVETYLKNKYAL